jgi:hypothetical protein
MSDSTKEQQVTDPHRLLESGEDLASLSELASMLGCSNNALHKLLDGPLRGAVRWARREPAPAVYCVADARAGFEPLRAEVEASRRRAIEVQEAARAAKAARIAAANSPTAKTQTMDPKARPVAKPTQQEQRSAKDFPISRRQPPVTPEVIVLRRRPSVRP